MKKSAHVLPILFALVIILGGCRPTPPPDLPVDPRCPTGITLSDIEVDENTPLKVDYGRYYVIHPVKAFIVSPNKGCNLPIQYCVLTRSADYGASVSCTTIP